MEVLRNGRQRQHTGIYEQPVIILTTANQEIYDRVKASLIAAGVAEKMIKFTPYGQV